MVNILKIKKIFSYFVILFIMGNVLFLSIPNVSANADDFHIRYGFYNPTHEYKFKNIPDSVCFIPEFPKNVVDSLPVDFLDRYKFEYWVYTSIINAELSMVEYHEMSSGWSGNIIDYPLPAGPIGDNCWYDFKNNGTAKFIRNNVLVRINYKHVGEYDPVEHEMIARKIDSALVKSAKVAVVDSMAAPIVHSVDILSDLPTDWDSSVKLKVNATDPNGKKLYFRRYATGFGQIYEDGIIKGPLFKNVESTEDSTKAKIKIWVWNDDKIVSSVEKEVPF